MLPYFLSYLFLPYPFFPDEGSLFSIAGAARCDSGSAIVFPVVVAGMTVSAVTFHIDENSVRTIPVRDYPCGGCVIYKKSCLVSQYGEYQRNGSEYETICCLFHLNP